MSWVPQANNAARGIGRLASAGAKANFGGYGGALGSVGNYAGGAGNAFGVLGGIQHGGVSGYGGAGVNAAQLANRAGLLGNSGTVKAGLGSAANVLGIYNGIKQGGVAGYGGAAVNAGQLANIPGMGYVAAPLALYNFGKNWKSGATGSDALSGAETGAEIGSIIPGIGTLVGGVIGGAAGALSSAFGPGAIDPETREVQGLIDATGQHGNNSALAASVQNPYLELAGLMDRRSSTLPEYAQYGRKGEQKFTNDMVGQINAAIKADPTLAKDPNAVYSKVVSPWVNKMGSGYNNVGQAYTATNQGLLEDMTKQYLSGQAAQNWKAIGGDSPFENIYQGGPLQAAPAPQTPIQTSNSMGRNPRGGNPMRGRMLAAEGGSISTKLRKLYEGSFKRHYDDGGGVDYFTPSYTDMNQEFDNTWSPEDSGLQTLPTDQAGLSSSLGQTGLDSLSSPDVSETSQASNALNDSSFGPNGSLSGLGSALGVSSMGQFLKQYGALAPLLSAALSRPKTASAPNAPAGYGAVPATATPSNPRSYTQPNVANWYTYGQGPEQSFFSNNQLPTIPGMSPNAPQGATPNMNTQPVTPRAGQPMPVMAGGGSFDSTQGDDYVSDPGHGDGTSDGIDAKLSGGEYVMDAGTVSTLGNGSNEAGARALDQLRQRVRKHAGKQLVKGKQFMKAKPAHTYLGKGKP